MKTKSYLTVPKTVRIYYALASSKDLTPEERHKVLAEVDKFIAQELVWSFMTGVVLTSALAIGITVAKYINR